ncbi:MAG: hypothetical protein ACON5A_00200 [Candidatus Comchoanobacterales bacterium]
MLAAITSFFGNHELKWHEFFNLMQNYSAYNQDHRKRLKMYFDTNKDALLTYIQQSKETVDILSEAQKKLTIDDQPDDGVNMQVLTHEFFDKFDPKDICLDENMLQFLVQTKNEKVIQKHINQLDNITFIHFHLTWYDSESSEQSHHRFQTYFKSEKENLLKFIHKDFEEVIEEKPYLFNPNTTYKKTTQQKKDGYNILAHAYEMADQKSLTQLVTAFFEKDAKNIDFEWRSKGNKITLLEIIGRTNNHNLLDKVKEHFPVEVFQEALPMIHNKKICFNIIEYLLRVHPDINDWSSSGGLGRIKLANAPMFHTILLATSWHNRMNNKWYQPGNETITFDHQKALINQLIQKRFDINKTDYNGYNSIEFIKLLFGNSSTDRDSGLELAEILKNKTKDDLQCNEITSAKIIVENSNNQSTLEALTNDITLQPVSELQSPQNRSAAKDESNDKKNLELHLT